MPPKTDVESKRDASPKRSAAKNNAVLIDANTGECKYIRVKTLEKMQSHVGGNIELLPRTAQDDECFEAYVNEEGELLKLASNLVAGAMLFCLGFATDKLIRQYIISGNALLMRPDQRPFSKPQLELIEKCKHVALQQECEAYDCYDSICEKDNYCNTKGCKNIICEDCWKQNRDKCEDHE